LAEDRNPLWHTPARVWSHLQPSARAMRRDATPEEDLLWERLRGRKFHGQRFRRQHALGPFIVDFFCSESRLIVEVDGGIHETTVKQDGERADALQALGFKVVRLRNREITDDMDSALAKIRAALAE